jgi:multidrug transporter EmrE-like cation transporter
MIAIYKYLYALYLASVDGIAMSFLKAHKLGIIKNIIVFPVAMIIYSLQPLVFYSGLSFSGMSELNILWDAMSDILVAIIGIAIFNEKITFYKITGFILCLLGIIALGID